MKLNTPEFIDRSGVTKWQKVVAIQPCLSKNCAALFEDGGSYSVELFLIYDFGAVRHLMRDENFNLVIAEHQSGFEKFSKI